MKNMIPFQVPFTGFSPLNFISCFTSTYIHLEDIPLRGGDGRCAQSHGRECNGCGNCQSSNPMRDVDIWYFLFDTMSGRSSLRLRFDGSPSEMQKRIGETQEDSCGTDYTVDFLFGFTGYVYRKLTDTVKFSDEVVHSIDAGNPVIAKVKTGDGRFRVITGYDDGRLICPDFINAQKRPAAGLLVDQLDMLYIIEDKREPRYMLTDGLKRICEVMEYNYNEGVMLEYILRLGWHSNGKDGMGQTNGKNREERMQRVCDTMWYTFNSHNFAEVFRTIRDDKNVYDRIGDMERLHTAEIKELCVLIGSRCYGYTHDLAWALIGLKERIQGAWETHYACGWAEMVEMVLTQINSNDKDVLEAIQKIIRILEK